MVGFSADPRAALIGFPGDEIHPPAVEALVLDPPLALAGIETQLLRLHAGKRLLGNDRKAARGCAATNRPPYTADLPPAAKCLEGVDRRRRSRFLETLAKDHLTVNAAVNFMVHVLDARPGQVARHQVNHSISLNVNGGFLGLAAIQGGKRREEYYTSQQWFHGLSVLFILMGMPWPCLIESRRLNVRCGMFGSRPPIIATLPC